jgi:hypothetical protein
LGAGIAKTPKNGGAGDLVDEISPGDFSRENTALIREKNAGQRDAGPPQGKVSWPSGNCARLCKAAETESPLRFRDGYREVVRVIINLLRTFNPSVNASTLRAPCVR